MPKIATVARGAHEGLVLAQLEATLAAHRAGVARPAESTDADALADAPRRRQRWISAVDVGHIGTAQTAGLDLDQHLCLAWLWRLPFDKFELTGPGDLHGAAGLLHLARFSAKPGTFWSTCRTPASAASTAPAR